MSERSKKPEHPGIFIRRNVIPRGMTVTEAAKKLGVGRPALSNLLNGNASLSHNMAVRLEKSFGADRKKLLDIQDTYDRFELQGEDKHITARTYVPNFLTIKARQIENWAEENIDARQKLAVLLRKLIHSTGDELQQVDFPGHDNAQRKGWDGEIVSGAATPWIPEGRSRWEFGTNRNPKNKADKDYVDSFSTVDRADCTFVFVTPRNWPGKTEWARAKEKEGSWKHVRAYDASDLEQWLEESIPGQMWLAEQLGMPLTGFETMDRSWRRWVEASEPRMVPEFFEPSITANCDTFERWLGKPSERPFLVAADSIDEALAFLACLFQEVGALHEDLAVVFDSPQTLRILVESASPFIPIVFTQEMERELATVYRRLHCIVVRPSNAVDSKPHIELERLNHDSFRKGLSAIGIEDDHARRLERASGRSPTILRRRLSKIGAIRTPKWSADEGIARSLIPIALVGTWHSKSNADREVVSTLSDKPYEDTERDIARFLQLDDCPVWSVGQYRGVVSKIDALFAISKDLIAKDLEDFFFLAKYVLSETDPGLELHEESRRTAGFHGKVRDHSIALRDGICETLVILSIHGNDLFQERIGMDIERSVSSLIRGILTALTLDKLQSHDRDLPNFAEAAPNEFLAIIEEDLEKSQPIVFGLLKPVEPGAFNSPARTGLLWALECLAWNHLGRVSRILAQLSRIAIEDSLHNRPIFSLRAAFSSWVPQTSASLAERMKALDMLCSRFPEIGWQICIEEIESGSHIGNCSYRPRWRSDASNAGRPVPVAESNTFARKALEFVLTRPRHDQATLGEVVERLPTIGEEDHNSVWDLIESWADSEQVESAKAGLMERIRELIYTPDGRQYGLRGKSKERAREVYDKLQPCDPVIRHRWLFAKDWVEPNAVGLGDNDFEYSNYEKEVSALRAMAMEEIWEANDFEGVATLLASSEAPHTIGNSLARNITSDEARISFLRQCLSTSGELQKRVDGCLMGFLMCVDSNALSQLLSEVVVDMDIEVGTRLLTCAPFRWDTWRLLAQFQEEIGKRYWQKVEPRWNRYTEDELMEIVDRLLEARRPHAAFRTVCREWSQVETSRLKRMLIEVATVKAEHENLHRMDPHHISDALDSLESRSGVTTAEMAQLEFLFIEALDHTRHGIPYLERQIAQSPGIFVQALSFLYKRNDDEKVPSEWRFDNPRRRQDLAKAAYRLFRRIRCIPGTGPDGNINTDELLVWVKKARRLSVESGRGEVGDEKIGELLSNAPGDEDGGWPCRPVCATMESVRTRHIEIGFRIGVLNSRSVIRRDIDEGGAQERELADRYRIWAKHRAFDFPFVSNVLEKISSDLAKEANAEDTEAEVLRRLEF